VIDEEVHHAAEALAGTSVAGEHSAHLVGDLRQYRAGEIIAGAEVRVGRRAVDPGTGG